MKKRNLNLYVAALLLAAIIFSFLTIYAFGEHSETKLKVSGRSAVLYQPDTKTFLYSKNADEPLPMASTTKIMTALIAIENSAPEDLVQIDDRAIGIEGSSAYLRLGDVITMEELLYALLLQSANDAACAIAYHIAGDLECFSTLMNQKAAELGLQSTNFTNPHGLDDEDHYTTAKELAIIAAATLENQYLRQIISTYKKTFTTEQKSRTYVNHNKLLRLYDGCIGIKTGFTKKSGRCLVGAAEKNGLIFISVTLDAPSDWNDHEKLLNLGFDTMERLVLSEAEDHTYNVPVLGADKSYITVKNTIGADVVTSKENHEIKEYIKLVRYCIAPINEGDILGEIIYFVDGNEAARVNLVAAETTHKKEKDGLFNKILSIFD